MNDLQKIIMILRDYEPDNRDGYVSNLDQYIESRCHIMNIPEWKTEIVELIKKTNKPFVCKLIV
jgi:hypothetical protein